jgi:hypothetical protein
MTDLQALDLNGTRITDAAIDGLKKFTGLRWVDLRDTKVTRAGAEELRKALPKAEVLR